MKKLLCFASMAVSVFAVGCQTSPAPQPTRDASGLMTGEIIYGYRCKGCHEPATPGAPDRKKLAALERKEIVKALRSGRMKVLSAGLTQDEMNQIALFLSAK